MVQNTVHATYTETYDLNTALNEISFIGLHTPQATALKSMYKGFFENYKKYKIVGCNIGMVCASQQSLTPDLVGTSGGLVDPRDVLNPILFKACTGEHLNEILNQIYHSDIDSSSLNQHISSNQRAINMYYQLLSDDSWRKEHPQRGIFIKGLKPLVHKIVTTQPFRWTGASPSEVMDYPRIESNSDTQSNADTPRAFGGVDGLNLTSYTTNTTSPSVFISDGTTDMPWLDTTFDGTINAKPGDTTTTQVRSNRLIVSVPRVWMGALILPPAVAQRLFFRCQIQWHVMFKDFRPAFEVGTIAGSTTAVGSQDINPEPIFDGERLGTSLIGNPTYWELYHDGSTKLDQQFSSFDVNGEAEVEQVMETAQ